MIVQGRTTACSILRLTGNRTFKGGRTDGDKCAIMTVKTSVFGIVKSYETAGDPAFKSTVY